jgi:hypothetical protein
MNVINSIFKTSWGIGRLIRLAIGVAFLFDAYYKQSGMVALMGAFLVYQAAFNTGCGLGNSSCSPTPTKKNNLDISHNFIDVPKR